jgi:molybdate transport system permease protein
MDLVPLWLTFKLALLTSAILFVLSIPLAFALVHVRAWIRYPLQTLVNMPLVLPPTVIGFYLLLLYSPDHPPGSLLQDWFGVSLAFTFPGLVVGSVIFSLPFMVNPILSGLENLPRSLSDASYALGATRWQTFLLVQLPNVKPSLLAGWVLTFAHTVGEFGVVLMIGGKIPGKTKVASMAVYDEVEALNYGAAHAYALVLCLVSFASLMALFLLNRRIRHPI